MAVIRRPARSTRRADTGRFRRAFVAKKQQFTLRKRRGRLLDAMPWIADSGRLALPPIRNGGRHRCQPPLSGFCFQPLAPVHPDPLLLRSAARKTIRRRAHGTNPAAVWSAPFRGPAAPGKPFIIWSEPLPKQSLLSGDGLHFHSGRVRFNSWELLRSVTGVSVYVLVDPLRSLRVGLATILRVPVVRRLCRPMIGS